MGFVLGRLPSLTLRPQGFLEQAQGDNYAVQRMTFENNARITELSVVAVTRDDLEQLHRDVERFNANR